MVNIKPVQLGKRTRMSFSKISEVLEMPNLIEVQKDSYQWLSLIHICRQLHSGGHKTVSAAVLIRMECRHVPCP